MKKPNTNLPQDLESIKRSIAKAGGLFYQYRPCRRNAETIYDIENIRHGVVYAQTPLNMNDPFDSMIGFSAEKVYSECISMLVDALKTDEVTKALVVALLQHRAFGKMAELIVCIKEIKQYLIQKRTTMHQTTTMLEAFVKINSKILYSKAPKKLRSMFLENTFYALMILISKLDDVDITEDSIMALLKMDEILDELHEAAVNLRDTKYVDELRKFLSQITVTCFSTSGWDNQLMWSHYANSYSGICVEYDFTKIDDFIGFIYPVKYTKERPTLSLQDVGVGGFSLESDDKIVSCDVNIMNIISYMLCKNTCWDYEQEWRIINIGKENTPIFINLPYIKSITFGPKTDGLCKKLLMEVCKENGICCFDLILNAENYNLERQEIDLSVINDDIDEETAYIQLLSKQIIKTSENMNAHIALVNDSIKNEVFDFDSFSSSLDEVLDLLSNVYFMKKSINRAGTIVGDELTQFAIPSGIITTINSADASVITFSLLTDTLEKSILGLSFSEKIKYNEYRTAQTQIRNIREVIEKINSYEWKSEFIKNPKNKEEVIAHYDLLIDEDNDPVHDHESLRTYMDKWDGQKFIDEMDLSSDKNILEIGVGTGRLALKTAPKCAWYTGVDISGKTIEKAKINLADNKNVTLLCEDFLNVHFDSTKFDVIYSSLTFMHISDKLAAINKVAELLTDDGIFVLSIEKDQKETIDYGTREITIYPDNPDNIQTYAAAAGMSIQSIFETEFANILVLKKTSSTNAKQTD